MEVGYKSSLYSGIFPYYSVYLPYFWNSQSLLSVCKGEWTIKLSNYAVVYLVGTLVLSLTNERYNGNGRRAKQNIIKGMTTR
jgi:hypothetical protein